MKFCASAFVLLLLFSCGNHEPKIDPSKEPRVKPALDSAEDADVFPVTQFLKGEIAAIKNDGYVPIEKTQGSPDSVFIHPAEFNKVFGDFLSPEIDSIALAGKCKGSKFLDQTLNAYTFTYDLLPAAWDSFAFRHWDVYVDPETQKVRRVYLLKIISPEEQQQLTWLSGHSAKIVTLKMHNGSLFVAKEENIYWKPEE